MTPGVARKIEAWMSAEARRPFPTIAERWKIALKDLPAKTAAYEKERAEFGKPRPPKPLARHSILRNTPKPPPGQVQKRCRAGSSMA